MASGRSVAAALVMVAGATVGCGSPTTSTVGRPCPVEAPVSGVVANVSPARLMPYDVARVDVAGDLVESHSWQPYMNVAFERHTSGGWRPAGWLGAWGSARRAHLPAPEPLTHNLTINELSDPFYFRAPLVPGQYRLCFVSDEYRNNQVITTSLVVGFRVGP